MELEYKNGLRPSLPWQYRGSEAASPGTNTTATHHVVSGSPEEPRWRVGDGRPLPGHSSAQVGGKISELSGAHTNHLSALHYHLPPNTHS